jgi:hypothetical protein
MPAIVAAWKKERDHLAGQDRPAADRGGSQLVHVAVAELDQQAVGRPGHGHEGRERHLAGRQVVKVVRLPAEALQLNDVLVELAEDEELDEREEDDADPVGGHPHEAARGTPSEVVGLVCKGGHRPVTIRPLGRA